MRDQQRYDAVEHIDGDSEEDEDLRTAIALSREMMNEGEEDERRSRIKMGKFRDLVITDSNWV